MSGWLLLLWLPSASAVPEDALNELLREHYHTAQQLESGERYTEAATHYRVVMLGDPEFKQAVVDLGRVLELDDRPGAALRVYASAPNDADAVEALGRLQLALGDLGEAKRSFERLSRLRPAWPGWRIPMAAATAPDDPEEAAALLLEYLDFVTASIDDEGMVDVTIQVCGALRDRDEVQAVELLERLVVRFQDDAESVARLEALLMQFEIDAFAEELAQAADVRLPPEDVDRLRRAREAFASGDVGASSVLLEQLVVDQPRSAVAWAALSDVRMARGDVGGAEQAIRSAQKLAPLEAAYPARLGQLLADSYGGRFDGEASQAFARAVRRRATDPELWVRKARADRRAGLWELSVAAYQHALELDPEAPWAEEARRSIEGAARQLPEDVPLPSAPGRPESVPEEAWIAFHRGWAWRERGAPDQALAEVLVARRLAPLFVRAINLEAAIRTDREELGVARALYRESLEIEPGQPALLTVLAELEERVGDLERSGALWAAAAAQGDPRALWRRAQAEATSGRWPAARQTLAAYFARTTSDPNYEDARALDALLQRRIRGALGGGLLGLGFVVSVPLGLWLRRRSGVELEVMLAASPRIWRDVTQICAAIRHEVLKHHASVLVSVADALDKGDREPAQWAADRLFGPGGALERLDDYVEELEALGRSSGVHLNLRFRDPLFRSLLAATARLQRLEPELRRGTGRHLAGTLRELSGVLNQEVYQALGHLVSSLSVIELDRELLDTIWQDVCDEPAFQGVLLPDLQLEPLPEGPLLLKIFPSDLRDILGNLIRNSVEACIESGQGQIGLAVALEEDLITGLERVVIRVRDTNPRRLTTQMIRGRYIGRGLGLAVDLTNRARGSIHVEPDPGWSKAIVVRLPRAERPTAEEWG
ncbi:MAG TPA: hypothetical protein ENK18_18990 [Deltaproteobacteria bacterium]|nr:hypothetical protein [Deltaproteobacteria bacterium]